MDSRKRFKAQEFAKLAGVTVRTLHHYDRLGLVKPEARTGAGYRLYGVAGLERIQQIVTLKFIGLSLENIQKLFRRKKFSLGAALKFQRFLIDARRAHYEKVLQVIDQAEQNPDWDSLREIIEAIRKEDPMDWTKKYYSEEAQKELEARKKGYPKEAREGANAWSELIQDVERALASGVRPTSAEGKTLAERWSRLVAAFTGGSPKVEAGLKKMYTEPSFKKPYSDEVGEFISQASSKV